MLEMIPALAEYGVAVFTVGVSLSVVWLLMNKFLRHSELQSKNFTETVTDLADRHERERGEWVRTETERLGRTDAVLLELRDAIRESINQKGSDS